MNRSKGYIGFSEAMLGTAAVCIVIIAFVAFAVPAMTGHGQHEDAVLPDTDGMSVTAGKYVWDHTAPMEEVCQRHGYAGMRVCASTCSAIGAEDAEWTVGDTGGTGTAHHLIINVPSDYGGRVPTEITVVVYG